MEPRGGESWRGVVVQWVAAPPPVWPSHEGSRGLARGSLRGTLHCGALHGGGCVMGGFPRPQHPLAQGLAQGPPVACCTAVVHCTAVMCEVCKPSVSLVQGGAVRCTVLVHGPSLLVRSSCQACARLVRAHCVPRVLLLHAARLCDRCASSMLSMGGGGRGVREERKPSCEARGPRASGMHGVCKARPRARRVLVCRDDDPPAHGGAGRHLQRHPEPDLASLRPRPAPVPRA